MRTANSLKQQHRAARSILSHEKVQRKKDANALAELIYDVFKEKKLKETGIMNMDQNNVQHSSTN